MPTNNFDYAEAGRRMGRALWSAVSGDAYQQGYETMSGKMADMAVKGAHADLYRQQADEIKRRAQFQAPEFADTVGAAAAGINSDQASKLGDYFRKGNWGQSNVEVPSAEFGPEYGQTKVIPNATPDWATPETINRFRAGRAAHLMNLGGTGNTNAKQMAGAVAELLGQDRIDEVLKDPSSPKFSAVMALNKASPIFHQGTNGVMNQFTGAETLNDVGRSAALQNRAQANNANSSAALHRAQIPEVQARTELTRSRIGAPQVVQNPDGTTTILDPRAKPGKPPTEFQSKSATFGVRMQESDKILKELEDSYNQAGALLAGGNGAFATALNPALGRNTQQVIQAQRDFINAVLRQESGAVISDSEFANATRQYFPQPGDSKEVIVQKRRNRDIAIAGMRNSAAHAWFDAPAATPEGNGPGGRTQAAPRMSQEEIRASVLRARKAVAEGRDKATIIRMLEEAGITNHGIK